MSKGTSSEFSSMKERLPRLSAIFLRFIILCPFMAVLQGLHVVQAFIVTVESYKAFVRAPFHDFSFVHQHGNDVTELIDASAGSSVLDLGCSNGALTTRL